METVEDGLSEPQGDHSKDIVSPIAKGKGTKRQRQHSPVPFTFSPTLNIPSPSNAVSEESTTTEEEDTARCLILLAQGYYPGNEKDHSHNRYKQAARGGACAYTCKTCGKIFSSFQALGGHRASHQKSKLEKKSSSTSFMFMSDEEEFPSPSISSAYKNHRTSLSLQLNNIFPASAGFPATKSPRIHECAYCGAEFTSGQALGGHMRRHRSSKPVSPFPKPPLSILTSKDTDIQLQLGQTSQNGLSLDLNLPAMEDETLRLGFDLKQQKSSDNGQHIKATIL